jgi:membrane-associated protease RseP (regulator of RpoE activity)
MFMKTQRLVLSLAVALLLPAAGVTTSAADTVAAPTQRVQTSGGYLGVTLAPVTDETRAQLGDRLPVGQGVMIRDVAPGSPASQAGLRPYDILLSYDDQRLYSAEQLSGLVRADTPAQDVDLQVVRGGTVEDVQATLGQRSAAVARLGDAGADMSRMPMPRQRMQPYWPWSGEQTGRWDSFDALSLKKLDDGDFQAQIKYLNSDGELVTKSYTGTRDTIRQQVMQQNDLPSMERAQLLDALSARDDMPFMRGPMFGHRLFVPPALGWPPDF